MEPVPLWNNDNFIVLQHNMTLIIKKAIHYLDSNI